MSLDDLFSQIQSGNMKELDIIVKADVQGSVEAVKQSLVKLSNEEVVVKVIHGGVGAINESDVILASASNAIIIGFNVRPDPIAKVTADNEGVDIRLYKVIYNAIEDVEAAMKGMLDPVFEEKVIGHAEIRQIFKASGVGNIAGSYVLDGIDHHISNQSFADENYIFPEASSASELVFELIPRERLTKEIAECIYTGIIHDTGVFQYSCTSEKTMEAAGVLMGMGIDFPKIVDQTFFTKTYEQNRIMGLALVKSKLHLDGKCISSIITAEEMREYNVLPKHLDGIVSQLRVTKDVEAAVFLYQTDEENYKVSTRSASYVDVAKIAAKYGGGGHVRAAGFSVAGDPEKRLNEIIEDIREQITD